jgi:hypothetical protein
MNGPDAALATSANTSPLLAAAADFSVPTGERIDALYLATLSRFPTDQERGRMQQYVDGGGPRHSPSQAFADVLWVLLNSGEFLVNH